MKIGLITNKVQVIIIILNYIIIMEPRFAKTVLVGTIAGILGGAFGLGGSFMMIPGITIRNLGS